MVISRHPSAKPSRTSQARAPLKLAPRLKGARR